MFCGMRMKWCAVVYHILTLPLVLPHTPNPTGATIVEDDAGKIVRERFKAFLQDFDIKFPAAAVAPNPLNSGAGADNEGEAENAGDLTTQQRHTFDYIGQIASMIQNNKTTLFVNFQHCVELDIELAEAIGKFPVWMGLAGAECVCVYFIRHTLTPLSSPLLQSWSSSASSRI